MKALTDKIIELLESKRDGWLGTGGEIARRNFQEGIIWAIETIQTLTRDAEFEEVARQLMKHMAEKYNPHHLAIVTSTNAQLLQGEKSTREPMDYISD